MPAQPTKAKKEQHVATINDRILAIISEMGGMGKYGKADQRMGGYDYVKMDDIEIALRPLLEKHGVIVVPSEVSVDVSYGGVDGKQCRAIVALNVSFLACGEEVDSSIQSIQIKTSGLAFDYSDKAIGKAHTAALKTAYMGVFHLRGHEDTEQSGEGSAGKIRFESKGAAIAHLKEKVKSWKGKKDPAPQDWIEKAKKQVSWAELITWCEEIGMEVDKLPAEVFGELVLAMKEVAK